MNARSVAASVASALALAAFAGCGGGDKDSRPLADSAAKLVPSDALVYVHLSTDRDRPATARAVKLAERFPSYAAIRDSIVRRLSAPGCRVDVGKLRGKEAALALLDAGGGTAGSLVLIDTGEEHSKPGLQTCGALQTRYVGHFLAIGQPPSIASAVGLAGGHGRSLAANKDYVRASSRLPAERVADAWATRDGVRRVLEPQGGVLGAAGALLDQEALRGAALGLETAPGEARVSVRSILEPAAKRRAGFGPFRPTLGAAVPDDAMAYLGVTGLADALRRILAAAGPSATSLQPLLDRLRAPLSLFAGEVALVITPAVPRPVLTVITRLAAGAQARAALAAFRKIAPGLKLSSAVVDGKLVVATNPAGVAAVRNAKRRLPATDAYERVLRGAPPRVTSLVFLDFSQLLRLGEQTGLNDSRAYIAVKNDLQKVRAVGAHSSSARGESTAEIILSIP